MKANSKEQLLGEFRGRIVTTEGVGIEGAIVTLPNDLPNPPLGRAVSDSEGRFHMEVKRFEEVIIHRVSHSLRVHAKGYAATYVDQRHLSLFEKAVTHLGEIVMDVGRTYSGRVVDTFGKPIAGGKVDINVMRFNPGSTWNPICDELIAATDDNGQFETPLLGGGIPNIGCSASGFQYAYYSETKMKKVGDDGRLPDLILQAEHPIHGLVTNEDGDPIPNVVVSESNRDSKTDSEGRFTLHGLGKNSTFQCQILHPGYAFVNLRVDAKEDRIDVLDIAVASNIENSTEEHETVPHLLKAATRTLPRLAIALKREATIQGHIIDTETDQPVEYSRIVLCSFTRNDEGNVLLDGCRTTNAVQMSPGQFLLAYTTPREYHLTVIAEGYEDGEAFTPPVDTLVPIDGIVVKMKRIDSLANSSAMVKQTIKGSVHLDGNPIPEARAAIWTLPREADRINAHIVRGRTSAGDGFVWDTQMVKNGMFSLNVNYPGDNWYVLVETPERVVALEGPFTIAKGETKMVEVVSRQSGSIYGKIEDVSTIREPLYAVLFSDIGLQYETRVAVDGSFGFKDIFPGKYGVKIGTDAIIDSEIPGHDKMLTDEECWEWNQVLSDPWKRAFVVEINEGVVLRGIKVAFQE
jgi:hypothetical protein